MAKQKKLKKPSQAKSEVAYKRERVNGRFVSLHPKQENIGEPNSPIQSAQPQGQDTTIVNAPEELYEITDVDRARFGSDSKAFFEWALTKALTRYEAAKYAKELMRFQYPTLQSTDSEAKDQVTTKIYRWDN